MIVFIGNLNAATTGHDLCRIARLPEGACPRIIKKPDGAGGLHRYGLVYTSTEREGKKLIRRIHGKSCHGHRLVAREFIQRAASNERRRLDWREVPWRGLEECRRGERRAAEG
jgi:hypothetical protein